MDGVLLGSSSTNRRMIEGSELAALYHVWAVVLRREAGTKVKLFLNDAIHVHEAFVES